MRFRLQNGLSAAGERRDRVPASDLHAAFVRGRGRAEALEGRYADVLAGVFRDEAKEVARRFSENATRHALVAAAATSASTMVAVYPTPEQADALARPNGEPAEIIHCTLAFLGETDADQAEHLASVLQKLAPELRPLEGEVGGVASFGSETGTAAEVARVAALVAPDGGYGQTLWNGADCMVWWIPADWTTAEEAQAAEQAFLAVPKVRSVYVAEAESAMPDDPDWTPVYANGPLVEPLYPSIALPDVPGLAETRHAVVEALSAAGFDYSQTHGWTPHVTLAYTSEPQPPPHDLIGIPLSFGGLYLTRGDIPRGYPLGGESLAAAGEPPRWTPPHPDEVFNPERFIDALRTKSDPVRQALLEAAVAEGLDLAGLGFDVTNPLVAGVLARTGAKVTQIAETTRAGVLRTIGTAYDQGLSVPDTASLLQLAIEGASNARATLIARTETTALVNGGDVAATQIVASETGQPYWKRWLTAPGAEHPRHEDYDGLDGQTVALDDFFDCGGFQAQYPGDPGLPPEECCNCRCTAAMVDSPDATVEGDEIASGDG